MDALIPKKVIMHFFWELTIDRGLWEMEKFSYVSLMDFLLKPEIIA